jgi:hypothetical protein
VVIGDTFFAAIFAAIWHLPGFVNHDATLAAVLRRRVRSTFG